jgi:hypothetical protein
MAESKPPYEQPARLAEIPPPEEFPRLGTGCSERGSFNGSTLTVPDELFVKQLSTMTVRKPPRYEERHVHTERLKIFAG